MGSQQLQATSAVRAEIPLSEAKRRLLDKLHRGEIAQTSARPGGIPRRFPGVRVPLSFAQEQIFSVIDSNPNASPMYNESITIYRNGALDRSILEHCLVEILHRHEAWRTTFDFVDGQRCQVVHERTDDVALSFLDVSEKPKAEREQQALALATADARRAFDLRQGPLLRILLVKLDQAEYRLFFTLHQLIVDGISVFRVLPSELATTYEAFAAGKPSPLPELPVQFGDFACWQRESLQDTALTRQLEYWESQLFNPLPVLDWPKNIIRPALQSFQGAIYPELISKGIGEELRAQSRNEGVTLFTILLAGIVTLLHLYTHQDDIIVGTLTPAGREYPEVQGLLGYFMNPVPLRFRLQRSMSFHDLVWQVRKVVSEAVANDDVPFHYLVKRFLPQPDPSRHPFFQVVVSLAPDLVELGPEWNQTFMDVESGGARWDLYLEFNARTEGVMVRAQYNPDLFNSGNIKQTLEDFEAVLKVATRNPAILLSELQTISV